MTNSDERQPPDFGPDYVKVVIDLPDEGDGYPPVGSEKLWAVRLDEKGTRVRLDNIPFYAKGVSSGDILRVNENAQGELMFQEVLEPSGNSTFQLLIYDEGDVQIVRDDLNGMNCPSERSDLRGLIAVEVPADVVIDAFLDYIVIAQDSGRLAYQEGALRHPLPD